MTVSSRRDRRPGVARPIGSLEPVDRGIWWTRRAWGLHLTVVVLVPVFLALCDWQVHRALSGNELSWAYVFEWPFFAAYAVFMWWKLVHEPPEPLAAAPDGDADHLGSVAPAPAGAGPHERPAEHAAGEQSDPDDELAAYNRYLSALEASGRRKHW